VKRAPLKKRLTEFPRQALHAERVIFRHPATQELVEIVAPIPEDLGKLLAAIDAEAVTSGT
jgi:23S rRNA pseudouridine1911/1915/1917 synthase